MADESSFRKPLEEARQLAHDLNNLLTTVVGFTDLALESLPEGHAVREDVLEIRKAATRAAEITPRLLAICRQLESRAGGKL